ncbi:signal peptidase I [Pacificitalea manganoxidans]|uniref:Signal peptidase I n=1 Tax=Pacificitalea manganoxidans TaxID=1411902 RepID=A0A291LVW5_9RHOB|nr:signal peptidase I [Pacificitalea manganoxidans]MAQ46418.1 signal peptidase I [Actibacterium sp.]OWU70840.1 signal peptidase [Roseovarius sp. 22II1-1F6A]ATI40863.1 signal peptidase I [Pacificitalea manganoxidans]MBF53664.1 signal peptidase I [Actibacterium sp.]MDR6308193.1 signal peptidase I [Pacificitalea manganoxidans]|tara:strand:+ start:122 stop:907 length:786 start_codon:yes stop_codon:yes gene_type:complete
MAKSSKKSEGIGETIKTVVYALLIAGIFRTLFFQPFWIPSGSMKETLLIGDFLFVNKMAYGYSQYSCPFGLCPIDGRLFGDEPERGDVVVFRHPVNGQDFIKRLIGLPGDKVQIRNGVVFVNDEEFPQEPIGTFDEDMAPQGPQQLFPKCANAPVGQGGTCEKEAYRETNAEGRSYTVLNVGNGPTDNTNVYTVPEGHYFFMGDNRDNSTDSRVSQMARGVGFVPYENLIGRADRVIFSSAGKSLFYIWTWRLDRFFEKVE